MRRCRDDRAYPADSQGLEALLGRRLGRRTNGLHPAHERRALTHKHAPLGRFDLPGVEAFDRLRLEHIVTIALCKRDEQRWAERHRDEARTADRRTEYRLAATSGERDQTRFAGLDLPPDTPRLLRRLLFACA